MSALATKKAPSRGRRILRRAIQALLVAAFVAVVAGGWVYHRARAQVSEGLWDLGSQMMRFAEAREQDTPRDLLLNGQTLRFSSGTADQSARQVLDFFEGRCHEADGGIEEQIRALRSGRPDLFTREEPSSPVLREDSGGRGYVACIDFGQSLGVTELGERLSRFRETHDVGDIGDMRYVFVEQYDLEGHTRTHFVVMWTHGPFDLDRMFPEEGDVPGRDIEGVGRPEDARRVLSSWERGQPYTISVYQQRGDEADLESFYRRALADEGWTLLESDRRTSSTPRMLVAERGDRMVSVLFSTDLEAGIASAAVIDGR